MTYKGRPAVLGYFMNIDQQKKLQDQLALEKARVEALIKNAPLIIVGLGEGSKILLFNDFAEKVTGYRREEVLGRKWLQLFIPPEMREELYGVWQQVVSSRATSHEYENPIVTKSGSRRLIHWYNTVITEMKFSPLCMKMQVAVLSAKVLKRPQRLEEKLQDPLSPFLLPRELNPFEGSSLKGLPQKPLHPLDRAREGLSYEGPAAITADPLPDSTP